MRIKLTISAILCTACLSLGFIPSHTGSLQDSAVAVQQAVADHEPGEVLVNEVTGKRLLPVYQVVEGYLDLDVPPGDGPYSVELVDEYAFYFTEMVGYYAIVPTSQGNEVAELGLKVHPIDQGLVGCQVAPREGSPRTTWTEKDNADNAKVYRCWVVTIERRPTGGTRQVLLSRHGKIYTPASQGSQKFKMGRFELGHEPASLSGPGKGRPLTLNIRSAEAVENAPETFEELIERRLAAPVGR